MLHASRRSWRSNRRWCVRFVALRAGFEELNRRIAAAPLLRLGSPSCSPSCSLSFSLTVWLAAHGRFGMQRLRFPAPEPRWSAGVAACDSGSRAEMVCSHSHPTGRTAAGRSQREVLKTSEIHHPGWAEASCTRRPLQSSWSSPARRMVEKLSPGGKGCGKVDASGCDASGCKASCSPQNERELLAPE